MQCRNLERTLETTGERLQRTDYIDILAQRAGSAAGRLQVELAQLRYRQPRLQGRG